MQTIKNIYKKTYIENRKSFMIGWIIFILITVLTAFLCQAVNLNVHRTLLFLQRIYGSVLAGKVTFLSIFLNNARACILMILFFVIPILFFPWIFIVFNSVVVGIVIYIGMSVHKNIFLLVVLGLLPHGIIELSAVILSACLTIRLQKIWIRKITNAMRLKSHRKPVASLAQRLKQVLLQFALIILPALFIAALIEAFITKMLLARFM
ncbi:MAG: stage II sporulation protein M [Sporolactobacillus sp.]